MTAARASAAVLLLTAIISGLGLLPRPAASQTLPAAITRLAADLDAIIDPDLAIWSVSVRSLDHDAVVFAREPRMRLDPASTIKLVTLAVAADRLGWDFRYETEVLAGSPVVDGTVTQDLVVRGTGDPTINAPGTGAAVFASWVTELRSAGVTRVDGAIIGDDSLFASDIWTGLGPGWGWDDLAFGFAAPSGALQHQAGVVVLTLRPGGRVGTPAELDVDPSSGLDLVNLVTTGPPGSEGWLTLRRLPGPGNLVARGTMPVGTPALTREVAVVNPTDFFVEALRRHLAAGGIAITGRAVDIDDLPIEAQTRARRASHVLVRHRSRPLSELALEMIKDSQNLYAESLLRSVALASATPADAGASQAATDTLVTWGLDESQHQIADGSGLSPLNLITSEALVAVLERMHDDPRHRDAFVRTLPVAGRDGTLTYRLRGTAAADNARAKTGTKTGVRSLAGYLQTRDGETLAFAFLANNFVVPGGTVTRMIDRAVARLADFSRAPDR